MWQSTSEPSVKNFLNLKLYFHSARHEQKHIIYSIQRFAFAFDKTNIKILQFACLL